MAWIKTVWGILNSKLFLLIVSIFLTAILGLFIDKWKLAKEDAVRWENNYSIIVRKNDTLRDNNGMLITRTQTLELTIKELKRTKDSSIIDLLDKLRASNIKANQVEELLSMKQTYAKNLEFIVLNKDSLIERLQMPVEVAKKFPPLIVGNYEDAFTKAIILYQSGNWRIDQSIVNEAYGVLYHQREKGFLGLRIGAKNWWFDYKETNPSIKTNIKFINVKKGKR